MPDASQRRPGHLLQLLGPSSGGIRRHVSALTEELRRRGWVVSTAGPAGVLDGLPTSLDHAVPVPEGVDASSAARAVRALRPLARSVDLVHAHGLKAGWTAALAHTAPVVVTVHNLVLDEASGRSAAVLRRLEGALPARVDAVIAVSPEVAARFPDAQHVRTIRPVGPPPVPDRDRDAVRSGLGAPTDAALVVCVARLHPQKGLDTLVAATRILVDAGRAVRVAVVGDGPDEAAVRAAVASAGLDDVVVLTGRLPHAASELAAADVVVCSSIWEGSPLAVAEALALGRPVVATAVGAIPDVVVDGVSGRLVPPRRPEALADAIAAVLDDPAAAARYGEAGRRLVAEVLGPAVLVDQVEAVYREVLGWSA